MNRCNIVFTAFVIVQFGFILMGSAPAFSYTTSLSTSGTVNIDVASSGNGANVGVDNLTVESTCPLGYTLSISGPNDSALYKNGDGTSSNKISPSSGTINNPLPIIGNDYLGTWGYSMTNNFVTGAFTGLTSTATIIMTKNSASGTGDSTTDAIPVYYGVSVGPTTEAGLYKLAKDDNDQDGSITYYLIPNPNCGYYRIKYHGNGASAATTMGISHMLTEEDGLTTDLAASNFQRPGYGFAGWSPRQLDPDTTSQTQMQTLSARGYIFGPNQTLVNSGGIDPKLLENVVIEDGEQVIYLYAVWVKPENGATLQNWTGCSSMSVGQVIALTDLRDNDTYAVAKLADNNCWMIENLRLDYDADFSNKELSQGFGKRTPIIGQQLGAFHGLARPENDFSSSTASNSIYTSNGSGSMYDLSAGTLEDIGTTYLPGSRFPRYNNDNTNSDPTVNPDTTTTNMTSTNQNVYSYGNYYSWPAAKANTGVMNNFSSSIDQHTSICPKGWHLPSGAAGGEFFVLDTALGGTGGISNSTSSPSGTDMSRLYRSYPNNFILSGYYDANGVSNRGYSADYWSSGASNYSNSYDFYIRSGYVNPKIILEKASGFSVRCVSSDYYTISFYANGGVGSMDDQVDFLDSLLTLNLNTFTPPPGKQFMGWNTTENGSGVSFTDGEEIDNIIPTPGLILGLYAQWQ